MYFALLKLSSGRYMPIESNNMVLHSSRTGLSFCCCGFNRRQVQSSQKSRFKILITYHCRSELLSKPSCYLVVVIMMMMMIILVNRRRVVELPTPSGSPRHSRKFSEISIGNLKSRFEKWCCTHVGPVSSPAPMTMAGQTVDVTDTFTYLVSDISSIGYRSPDIRRRLSLASVSDNQTLFSCPMVHAPWNSSTESGEIRG